MFLSDNSGFQDLWLHFRSEIDRFSGTKPCLQAKCLSMEENHERCARKTWRGMKRGSAPSSSGKSQAGAYGDAKQDRNFSWISIAAIFVQGKCNVASHCLRETGKISLYHTGF